MKFCLVENLGSYLWFNPYSQCEPLLNEIFSFEVMDRAIYLKLIPLYLYGFACSYNEWLPYPGSPVPVPESYERWHLSEIGLWPYMLR